MILGWSTGHAGTTTFGTGHHFRSGRKPLEAFAFAFEVGKEYGLLGAQRLQEAYTAGQGSSAWQTGIVKELYAPYIANVTGKKGAYVDLSHQSLLLMDGYLSTFACRLRLIRIRRARLETAASHIFSGYYYYEPGRGYPVLLPTDARTWGELSPAQKGMWFMDEVEARWQLVSRRACSWGRCLEVHARATRDSTRHIVTVPTPGSPFATGDVDKVQGRPGGSHVPRTRDEHLDGVPIRGALPWFAPKIADPCRHQASYASRP